jgi:hypothetical protein
MRVGLFRRLGSFFFDAMPVVIIVSLLFTLFIGDILKPENYDSMYAEYQEISEEYFGDLQERYLDGEFTADEYQERYASLLPGFQRRTEEHYALIVIYVARVVLYHVLSIMLVYFAYVVVTKGRTLGRRMLQIELGGKVTFWRLFVREIIWRIGYWTITLFIGGILFDIYMIAFSKAKLTLRDKVSGIYVKYEGVDYPF